MEYYIDGALFHTSDLPAITSTNFTPTIYSYEISQTEDILTLSVMETDQELSAYADLDIGYNNKHIFLIHNGIMQIDFLRTE